ncbi:MAG TPA: LPS export ABC transporter periplasmic protein LptC [Micavibrio sp.]
MKEEGAQTQQRAERLSRLMRAEGSIITHSHAYTRFVKAMRWALPALAVLIVVIVMAWPKMETSITPVTPENVSETQAAPTQNELINPRFEGADSANNPYVLTATRAVQSTQNPDLLLLTAPQGDITLTNQEQINIKAQEGHYRQEAGLLHLQGDVIATHSNGYELTTTRLMIDTKARETRTDQAVTITGPAGTLNASGMDGRNAEGILVFTGPATLLLKQSLKGL